jgi:hypothetical protein
VAKLWKTLTRSSPLSMADYQSYFQFGGLQYPMMGLNQTLGGTTEKIEGSFAGYVEGAYKNNGVVFACMLTRQMLFSEARFQFRQRSQGRPGDLFGTPALAPLEKPWRNGTTGDLLGRAMQDIDLAGNFYAYRDQGRIIRMRPDWVTIIMGSNTRRDAQAGDLDAEVIGYVYEPGGPGSGRKPVGLLPESVAHFAPTPDPTASYRGMSWLTPLIQDITADASAMRHKQKFFENGATGNMVVSLDPAVSVDAFEKFKTLFEGHHRGVENAYETIFLGGGADVKVVGSDLKQVDFAVTQAHGELRIAAVAGAGLNLILGLGGPPTYANFAEAKTALASITLRPLWRDFANSIASIIDVPAGAELWYDDRDIPFLAEDIKQAAEVQQLEAVTMRELINAGFDPQSVTDAVMSGDFKRLKHTGLVSVQLQAPGATPQPSLNGSTQKALPAPSSN